MADRHLHLVYDADTNNSAPPPQTFDTGGGGGNNGDMRDRLTALETRFDSVLPTLATKADIEDLRTGIHKVDATIKTWMLGTVLTIIGTMLAAIFGVAQIFKNSSTPTVQTSAPSPVIIQVPTPPLSSK